MRYQSIISGSIGNLLEWYDFGLFAIFSPMFSRLFFPMTDAYTALILIFGVLAVGFLCRPIGALLFGYLGDKRGRAKTLRLSILMISVPTLLIGLLPTYQSIGIAAPLLLVGIRMWQGISLGGEYGGSLIYLAEFAPVRWRATVTSLAGTGANLGILLASMASSVSSCCLSEVSFESFGWRLPYILSGLLSIFIYITRLKLKETTVFIEFKHQHLLVSNPLTSALKSNLPQVLRTIGMACMGSTFYYLCFIYMPTFLMQNLHFSIARASSLMTIFIGAMILFVPLAGMLCDYVGRRKLLLFNAVLIALVIVPGFHLLLTQNVVLIYLILAVFTLASSLEQATTSVAVVENFPMPARYTGLSLGYNLSYAIFGGTAPVICAWLIGKTGFVLAPAFYIMACAVLTGVVVFFFVPETRGCDLMSKVPRPFRDS